MAKLNIPTPFQSAFKSIFSLDADAVSQLAAVLGKSGSLLIGSETSGDILKELPEESFSDARALIDSLLTLYLLKANTGKTAEQIAQDVVDSMVSAEADSEISPTDPEQYDPQNLVALLSVEEMDICAKATGLRAEAGLVFADARVVTDIRPVFGTRVDAAPVGAVLVHNLKIEFMDSGEPKELFFALDCKDVTSLIKVLERAVDKENALTEVLASSGLTIIRSKEN